MRTGEERSEGSGERRRRKKEKKGKRKGREKKGRRVGRAEKRKECFFFNDTATTEIYTLSLHDALPISSILRMSLIFNSFRSNQFFMSRIAEDNINIFVLRPF